MLCTGNEGIVKGKALNQGAGQRPAVPPSLSQPFLHPESGGLYGVLPFAPGDQLVGAFPQGKAADQAVESDPPVIEVEVEEADDP